MEDRNRERKLVGKKMRKLAGEGDSLSWIFREEAEERTEDFSGEKTEEMRRRERYDIYHGSWTHLMDMISLFFK